MSYALTVLDVAAHNESVMAGFAASRLRLAGLEVPDSREVKVLRGIEFSRPEGDALLLDLYLPAHPDGPLPLVIWVHGGGWSLGDKSFCPDLKRWFASAGLAMASIDYRLSGQAHFPAPLEDVRAAIKWLKDSGERYGLDRDAVGLWGASAGAHLATLAALTATGPEDAVQAVVDGYAPTDLLRSDEGAPKNGLIHDCEDSAEAKLLGARPAEVPELARAASPLAHVHSGAPPFLILHGDADLIVPARQSELLYEALASSGCEATLYTIKGLDHGFLNTRELEERPCPPTVVRSMAMGGLEKDSGGPPATFELIGRFFDHHLRSDPW